MRRLFGTDGVRGVANVDPMTTEVALALGRAVAHVFKRGSGRHRIVIGKDTRLSGYMFEMALSAGICSMGVDVLLVGPLPTPGIAFITHSMRADAGVVISASHNPFQDNGIKFFARDGFKLPDELEAQIEALVDNGVDGPRPTAHEVGKAFRIDDAVGRYVVFLKHTFPRDLTLEGVRIVLDCANGAAYKVGPAVFEELGAELVLMGVRPNGVNINDRCGAVYPEGMARAVVDNRADLGIALDGDADRVVLADERGTLVDGDAIMAICGPELLRAGTLRHGTVVTTVMSNLGLERVIRRAGGRVVRTQVGDRYVVEEMRRGGYAFGGEQSGHIIFLDHNTTGDGILTALQILAIMRRRGRPLSELAAVLERVPQVLVNVEVPRKVPLSDLPEVTAAVRRIEAALGEEGRLLVRYSGTENLLRIMIEGPDEGRIRTYAQELAEVVRRAIG
ncbi:MAG TPA: phosphoglucosamine mutase [Thermodesulfobacteriota bacterium]|nr:phosphoglucosamine mutase [Thermodesulfobacteriota bacterium]